MDKKIQGRTARETVRADADIRRIQFSGFMLDMIRERISTERRSIDAMKQELILLEDRKLRIHKREKGFHFGCAADSTSKEQSINDDEKVYRLARRQYLEDRISLGQSFVHRLSKAIDVLDMDKKMERCNAKLDRFNEAGLDLSRIVFTPEQNEWIDQPYTPNPFHLGKLKYATKGGIWMRSMAETKIGNTLETFGIPYRYDDLVTFGDSIYREQGYNKPHRDSYFADFKIVNFCAGITVHEHLGAFQIEQYADNALWRLNDYRTFEVKELPGRRVRPSEFTWSFEGDLLDPELFQMLFRRILFPELV